MDNRNPIGTRANAIHEGWRPGAHRLNTLAVMPNQLTDVAEGVEAEFMYQYVSSAPHFVKSQLEIATARIGGGVALSVRNDLTGYWSKALGFGFVERVGHDLISRVLNFYREQNTPQAVIQIAPSALPMDWDEIRARYDIRPESTWLKLSCPIEDFRPSETQLRVTAVGPATAAEWASVTLRGFGMPEEGLVDMLAASIQNPNFRPFAAWDGGEMVAAANLFLHGQIGSLNAAATLPEYRNRGAQSALLSARATEAANAGCHRLVAETGKPEGGASNSSMNNLLRSGLRTLYTRQNWIWRQATDPTREPSPGEASPPEQPPMGTSRELLR